MRMRLVMIFLAGETGATRPVHGYTIAPARGYSSVG
jgi:hypothetical protein